MIKSFVLHLTYRVWHPMVVKILLHAYRHGVLNSQELHRLTSMFDRTQKAHCIVWKV